MKWSNEVEHENNDSDTDKVNIDNQKALISYDVLEGQMVSPSQRQDEEAMAFVSIDEVSTTRGEKPWMRKRLAKNNC